MKNLLSLSAAAVATWMLWGVTLQAEDKPAGNSAEIFKKLDKNSDGTVGPDEVSEDQKRFFDRLIRNGDKNEDGRLSRDEFDASLKSNDRPVAAPEGQRGPGRGNFNPKEMFERLDRNKNGKISKDEIPEPLKERIAPLFERLGKDEVTLEDFEKMRPPGDGRPPKPEEIIERFDKNGDKKVSLDELPEFARNRMRRAFEKAGKDALSAEELAEVMRRPGGPGEGRGPMGRGPGPKFIQKIDTDKDGKITKEEFAKLAGLFDEFDEDGNGVLDPRELFGPPPGGRRPEGEGPPKGRRPDRDGPKPDKRP